MDTKQIEQIIKYIDEIQECIEYSNFPLMDQYINDFMVSYTKNYMEIISICNSSESSIEVFNANYWTGMTSRILETIKSKDVFEIMDLVCFELRDSLIMLANQMQSSKIFNPYLVEANYNLAESFYLSKDYKQAAKYYMRAKAICEKRKIDFPEINKIEEKIEVCMSQLSEWDRAIIKKQIEYAIDDPFRKITSLAGDYYIDESGNRAYVGLYNEWAVQYCGGEYNPANYEYELFWTDEVSNAKRYDIDGEYIVPVIGRDSLSTEENWIRVDEEINGKSSTFPMMKQKSYSYLRLHGKSSIAAVNPVVFGNPIELKHHNKKKLIINLFVDSFNYRIFDLVSEDNDTLSGFKKLMPNTYEFFSSGVICTNAYSDSEWTTPSLSSYWTGLYSHKHMNVDEHLWWSFPESIKLLPEYFKEAGYMTCRLGENQESANPSQGYMKGIDRFVCKQGHNDIGGFISETIDQIEAFKDTDQFIWVSFEDLHRIAGSMESDISIQTNTPVSAREQDNEGTTTVKQGRSLNKQVYFEKELMRMDRNLGVLFDYLKRNYSEDEYVVSLFSDHGTAFLVDDDQPMICEQRTHIPMMFYSSEVSGICDEFVQNVDYGEIMCKLAGIEYIATDTDAVLPVIFGGNQSREYVLSQTIYIGDPYQAMIRGKDFTYYYKTNEAVDVECRINNQLIEETLISDDGGSSDHIEIATACRSIIEDIIKSVE